MKLLLSKKQKGNLAYGVEWISIGNRKSGKSFDTAEEALKQIEHLISLGYKHNQIAAYIYLDIVVDK